MITLYQARSGSFILWSPNPDLDERLPYFSQNEAWPHPEILATFVPRHWIMKCTRSSQSLASIAAPQSWPGEGKRRRLAILHSHDGASTLFLSIQITRQVPMILRSWSDDLYDAFIVQSFLVVVNLPSTSPSGGASRYCLYQSLPNQFSRNVWRGNCSRCKMVNKFEYI